MWMGPMMQNQPLKRIAIALAALAVLAACEKHDATAGQAASALNNLASQTNQKFDQAASYVGQHVDAAKQAAQDNLDRAGTLPSVSASGVAETARANLEGAASATNAAIANAASSTGAGLETAGKKLQQWSAKDGIGNQGASASSAAESSETRTDMDK
jgi:hypothetical protein